MTHHAGVTLIQSVVQGLAVGATLKLVRGYASSVLAPATARDGLLDSGNSGPRGGKPTPTRISGVMASVGKAQGRRHSAKCQRTIVRHAGRETRFGWNARREPACRSRRLAGWIVAADSDILETDGPYGTSRRFAAGTEGRVHRKATVRGGFSLNTADGHRARSFSVGGSFAATASVFLDFQVTGGSDQGAAGLGCRREIRVLTSYQLSAISYQLSAFSSQSPVASRQSPSPVPSSRSPSPHPESRVPSPESRSRIPIPSRPPLALAERAERAIRPSLFFTVLFCHLTFGTRPS